MISDDITRLAREAGFVSAVFWPDGFTGLAGRLERFAELVAAEERNKKDQKSEKYFCPVCNSQEMVRARFDEESG